MRNVPNTITAIRTMVAVGLAVTALAQHSPALLVAAYATYWVGDIADGAAARALGQETRVGAVFDIVADRACTATCAAALIVLRPETALPVGVFLFQFMVVDQLLSLAFLRWPLLSPNHFARVDRRIWWWNWSPPAKAANTGALIVLVVLSPSPWLPLTFALTITAVKVASLVAVTRLTTPMPAFPTPVSGSP
ncbi:CDP-diacylglycerol--glycerol-3-phosphate 3-phosphatidyltransferase [Micromonospora sediminicola]|uniref:CDP-diacylglycerol--glycerol-3-phosphate 3-phosphatidyltransferase n=1 Tax=Micromonospora sediminicola TaxID=946078 RepID=A0A1A9BF37_9ACTN|nr:MULTISPECIES: CDP-alcohol phosphatidyltransferase family protein [Micromonospora]PGH45846.1 CDP-alcohol phosphatidyltransferase [Micromonospora sp. WMMA1996]SBT67793.1 CDP-diacylglycerol--glycerol-3-phosphate 3-phosphatidyltransferase [Micromonospora sediminicola]